MATCETPLSQFSNRFFSDIGVGIEERLTLACKLTNFVIATYNANKPSTTISQILNNLENCIAPQVDAIFGNTGAEVAYALFYVLIITIILVVLVVVIMMILDKTHLYGWIIGLVVFFAVLYVVLAYFLIRNAQMAVNNAITQSENDVMNCVNIAIAALTLFISQQETAIQLALCAYPTGSCLTANMAELLETDNPFEIEAEKSNQTLDLKYLIENVPFSAVTKAIAK